MRAFVISLAVLAVVSLGVGVVFHDQIATPAADKFQSDNVRLD